MKFDTKPVIALEVTLTLNHEELTLLNRLASYGISIVEPITGKNPLPHVSEPWEKLFRDIRETAGAVSERFAAANEVFAGKAKRRRAEAVTPPGGRIDTGCQDDQISDPVVEAIRSFVAEPANDADLLGFPAPSIAGPKAKS